MNKTFLKIVAHIAFVSFLPWVFNHVNPWIAIVIGIAYLAYLINLITNISKSK